MQIIRGCASSRISNWRASCGHGLNQVANHLLWDGHPLLKCLEQLLMQMCRFVHSPSNTSVQLVPDLLDWAEDRTKSQEWVWTLLLLLARNCEVWQAALGLGLSCWNTAPEAARKRMASGRMVSATCHVRSGRLGHVALEVPRSAVPAHVRELPQALQEEWVTAIPARTIHHRILSMPRSCSTVIDSRGGRVWAVNQYMFPQKVRGVLKPLNNIQMIIDASIFFTSRRQNCCCATIKVPHATPFNSNSNYLKQR